MSPSTSPKWAKPSVLSLWGLKQERAGTRPSTPHPLQAPRSCASPQLPSCPSSWVPLTVTSTKTPSHYDAHFAGKETEALLPASPPWELGSSPPCTDHKSRRPGCAELLLGPPRPGLSRHPPPLGVTGTRGTASVQTCMQCDLSIYILLMKYDKCSFEDLGPGPAPRLLQQSYLSPGPSSQALVRLLCQPLPGEPGSLLPPHPASRWGYVLGSYENTVLKGNWGPGTRLPGTYPPRAGWLPVLPGSIQENNSEQEINPSVVSHIDRTRAARAEAGVLYSVTVGPEGQGPAEPWRLEASWEVGQSGLPFCGCCHGWPTYCPDWAPGGVRPPRQTDCAVRRNRAGHVCCSGESVLQQG